MRKKTLLFGSGSILLIASTILVSCNKNELKSTTVPSTTINKEAGNTVLIQGVAGSGKTTVALHRLSWLLDKGNSDLTAEDCVILTLGPSLREYVKSSLAALEIAKVPVFSYREWCGPQIVPYLPDSLKRGPKGEPELSGAANRPGASVERVKRSMGLLRALEKNAAAISNVTDPLKLLLVTLSDPRLIKEFDETKLLSNDIILAAYERTKEMATRGTLDRSDYSLLLRCVQLLVGPTKPTKRSSLYRHLVIDEVQDYSPIELATVLSVVTEIGNLTLVGDTSQRTEDGFPGWDKLRKWWTARKIESSFVKLEVSHRSTKAIVTCASVLGKLDGPVTGRPGPLPKWFFGKTHEYVLEGLIDWLKQAIDAAPNSLIGVLCFSAAEVKEAYSLISPKFGAMVRIGNESGFTFEEGIVVCEVYQAKGLEFNSVLVLQPTKKNLPEGDVGRNLLYIAATRAQEQLAFATWGGGESPLRACSERVLEKIDCDQIEPEEEESNEDQEYFK